MVSRISALLGIFRFAVLFTSSSRVFVGLGRYIFVSLVHSKMQCFPTLHLLLPELRIARGDKLVRKGKPFMGSAFVLVPLTAMSTLDEADRCETHILAKSVAVAEMVGLKGGFEEIDSKIFHN